MVTIELITPDDYRTLPENILKTLDNYAAEINIRAALTFELIRQIGERLESVKALITNHARSGDAPDKMFMAWCRDNFEVSYATLETWRNIYKRLPPLSPEVSTYISRTAAGKLAQPGTNPEGLAAALRLAEDKKPVSPKAGWILGRGADYIREAYIAGTLPEDEAYKLTRKLIGRRIPEPVRDLCVTHKAPNVETIDYIEAAYKRAAENPDSLTWESVQDGTLNGFGWAVPISEARPIDIERHKVDMQARHIDAARERFDWFQTGAEVRVNEDGSVCLHIESWQAKRLAEEAGEKLTVKIRLPIRDAK